MFEQFFAAFRKLIYNPPERPSWLNFNIAREEESLAKLKELTSFLFKHGAIDLLDKSNEEVNFILHQMQKTHENKLSEYFFNTLTRIQKHIVYDAVNKNNIDIVRFLITKGYYENLTGNASTDYHVSKLQPAGIKKSCEIIKLLHAAGVTIENTNFFQAEFIFRALEAQHNNQIVKLLTHYKININNACYGYSSTLLQTATARAHTSTISVLLTAGADVNKYTYYLQPLELAIINGHIPAVKLLLSAGSELPLIITTNKLPIRKLIEVSKIADKIVNGKSLLQEDINFIKAHEHISYLVSNFIERAGILLAKKSFTECSTNFNKYSDIPYFTEIKDNFYNKFAKMSAKKEHIFSAWGEFSPIAFGILFDILNMEECKNARKIYLKERIDFCKENYKKSGLVISANQYSDIIKNNEFIKAIISAYEEIKCEYLNLAFDILAEMFGMQHIPSVFCEMEESGNSALSIMQAYKLASLEECAPSKVAITTEIFDIVIDNIDNPRKFLLQLLKGEVALDDERTISVEKFLRLRDGAEFNSHQAAVYNIIFGLRDNNMLPEKEGAKFIAQHCEHMHVFETSTAENAVLYGENVYEDNYAAFGLSIIGAGFALLAFGSHA